MLYAEDVTRVCPNGMREAMGRWLRTGSAPQHWHVKATDDAVKVRGAIDWLHKRDRPNTWAPWE